MHAMRELGVAEYTGHNRTCNSDDMYRASEEVQLNHTPIDGCSSQQSRLVRTETGRLMVALACAAIGHVAEADATADAGAHMQNEECDKLA